MNNRIMMLIETVAGVVAVGCGASLMEKSYNSKKQKIRQSIADNISPEKKEFFHKVKKAEKAVEELDKAERKAFKEQLDILEPVPMSEQIKTLSGKVTDQIMNYKSETGYAFKKEAIQNGAEDAIKAFKTEINYDNLLKESNRKIQKANDTYNLSKKLLNGANPTEEMKKAAKKVLKDTRDAAIKPEEEAIEKLKKTLSDFETKTRADAAKEIKVLDDALNAEMRKITAESAEAIAKIKSEHTLNSAKAWNAVYDARTDEQKQLLEDLPKLIDQRKKEQLELGQITNGMIGKIDKYEAAAEYLKEKKVSKAEVVLLACLPVAPFVHGAVLYFKHIVRVLKKM